MGATIPSYPTYINVKSFGALGNGTYRYGTADTGRTTSLPSTAATIGAATFPWWVAVS